MLSLKIKNINVDIIYEYENDLPIVFFKLIFKNAGKISEKQNAGLASMLARVFNEGSNDDFFKKLEYKAITMYAESNFEHFKINIRCLKEHFDFAIEKLEELLLNVRFEEKILQRLKIIAIGELLSLNTDYDYQAERLLNKNVFKDEIFQTGIEGSKESIEKISLKELKDFMSENLNLNNALFVFGGDIKEDEVRANAEKIGALLSAGTQKCSKKFQLLDKNTENIEFKNTKQAYIYFCSPLYVDVNDECAYLAKLALFILGQGGFGSRLMEEIRVKRGLAYSAYAKLDINLNYNRVFGYLQTKNESAKLAKDVVKNVFEEFVSNGANEKEFEITKKFLIGSMPLRYESLSKRLEIMVNEYLLGLKFKNGNGKNKKFKFRRIKFIY
nr:pitrilysin family protein [Campylobacter sp.]